MAATILRRFSEEIVGMIGRRVGIETSDGKTYEGDLVGVDEKLDVILSKVIGGKGNVFKLVLNGAYVKEVRLLEKPFDLRALSERLGRVFPGLVKIREDIGAIIVMDKIKVTEMGVVEGSGLSAERVKSIYDEFLREKKTEGI